MRSSLCSLTLLLLFLLILLVLLSSADATSCNPGTYVLGYNTSAGTCSPCPAGTISSTLNAFGCDPCPIGYQPNSDSDYCDVCAPGTYAPPCGRDWIGSLPQPGVHSMRFWSQDNPYYIQQSPAGGFVWADLPQSTATNTVLMRKTGANGRRGTWTLCLAYAPQRCLTYDLGGTVNFTNNVNTAAWRNAVTWVPSHTTAADTLDANGAFIVGNRFQLSAYNDQTYKLSCPFTVKAACTLVQNPGAGAVNNTYFSDAPPLSRSPSKLVLSASGATITVPSSFPDNVVSLQLWGDPLAYVTALPKAAAYGLSAAWYQRGNQSFVVVPALDGGAGVSLQSLVMPTKYLMTNGSKYTTAPSSSSPDLPVFLGVPGTADGTLADASWDVKWGLVNGSAASGHYSIRSHTVAMGYLSAAADAMRANRMVVRTINTTASALPLLPQNMLGAASFYFVGGLSGLPGQKDIKVGMLIAGRTKYLGTDGVNAVGSNTPDAAAAILRPPLTTFSKSSPWPSSSLTSIYFVDGFGRQLFLYANSYALSVTATPAAINNPDAFIFSVQPTTSVTYPRGVHIYHALNASARAYYNPSTNQVQWLDVTQASPDGSTFFIGHAHTVVSILWGEQSHGSVCLLSPAGSSAPSPGLFMASSCLAGTYSPSGATSCTTCAAGTFSAAMASSCTTCAPGTATGVATGATSCVDCGAGQYSAGGATHCTNCAAGTYNNHTRQSACLPCAPGSFQSGSGSGQCTLCPIGKFSASGASSCTECGTGSFANTTGSTACEWCPAGFYQDAAGATTCKHCPVGSYVAATGADACLQCPNQTYSDATASTSCMACVRGVTFAAGLGNTGCTSCTTLSYKTATDEEKADCFAVLAAEYAVDANANSGGDGWTGGDTAAVVVGAVFVVTVVLGGGYLVMRSNGYSLVSQ